MNRRTVPDMLVPTVIVLAVAMLGCAPEGGYDGPSAADGARAASEPGSRPTGIELLYLFENVRSASYFPFEALAGVAWGEDGTMIVCDEGRGLVHGLDPRTQMWYQFDQPPGASFRPVGAAVDGFKVLVLDIASRSIFRYDLGGVYQDRIVDFAALDPAFDTVPAAFDVDVDGRVVVADGGEEQVVMLDSFLAVQSRVGNPGPHREQFSEPSGVCYLPDGGFVVADRGNRRLQEFNRLGFWRRSLGGQFDTHNPYVTPQGLDCDRWGNLFVADPAAGVVHIIDQRGDLVLDIGPQLDLKGAPLGPMDVAVGPDQKLVVTDRLRHAVLVYRISYD